MIGTHDLPLFIVAGLLLNITPGADTLYIIGRSASQGSRAGAIAALGIGAGCLVHIVAATVGLSTLLHTSAIAFSVLKIAGAAYLIWLGVSMLRDSSRSDATPNRTFTQHSLRKVFVQGFLTNVLNPKVALFFLAFLPQFIDAHSANKAAAMLSLGLLFMINGTIWNVVVAYSAATVANKLAQSSWVAITAKRVAGCAFLFLGFKLALSKN